MKLLYVAPVYIEEECPDGVAKKVFNQYSVLKKKFDAWLVFYGKEGISFIHDDNVFVKKYGKRHRRFFFYSEVKHFIKNNMVDSIYIRYPKSESKFISLLKEMKKSGAKVLIEIPTYPYNGEVFQSVRVIGITIFDWIYRKQLKKYVDRIVTFSDDESIFGINTIRTINGIVFDRVAKRNYITSTAKVNMIAVATIYNCHGFDRIIAGIEKYYLNGGTDEIHFNIVGNGPYVEKYKQQLELCKYAKEHVVLCGFKTGDELDRLYNEANIAVNSLAIHRIGLKKESTLKTKEYAAKGLPIISSYEVDAFDSSGNEKFVLRVNEDDTPIDMKAVISFCNKVYRGRSVQEVSEKIREESKRICDMPVTLRGVMDYIINGDAL